LAGTFGVVDGRQLKQGIINQRPPRKEREIAGWEGEFCIRWEKGCSRGRRRVCHQEVKPRRRFKFCGKAQPGSRKRLRWANKVFG